MIKRLTAGLLAPLLLLSLAGCGQKAPELQRYEATFLTLFDTMTTIVGYRESREAFTAEAQAVYDDLKEYHELYDIYHSYPGLNNLKTVNENAGGSPVEVDRRIIGLLLEAKALYARTDGRMNVAFGSVLSIWHDYRERGVENPEQAVLPPMELLEEAALHVDIEQVEIDEAASTVRLADPGMRLDVGAIAKGYATGEVCRKARERGVKSLLVSVGGNVCAVGQMDSGAKREPWRVGIPNPVTGTLKQNLYTVGLRDGSLVTSGNYQRYYTVDGVEYHHIIDPETLMPARYFTAVSVITPDSGAADALSTALYNLPCEEGAALVEALEDTEALWVFADGSEKRSSGFGGLTV